MPDDDLATVKILGQTLGELLIDDEQVQIVLCQGVRELLRRAADIQQKDLCSDEALGAEGVDDRAAIAAHHADPAPLAHAAALQGAGQRLDVVQHLTVGTLPHVVDEG